MNNYQSATEFFSIVEQRDAQAQYLLTLQTLESMIEHAPNDIWANIFKNSLRLMEGEKPC